MMALYDIIQPGCDTKLGGAIIDLPSYRWYRSFNQPPGFGVEARFFCDKPVVSPLFTIRHREYLKLSANVPFFGGKCLPSKSPSMHRIHPNKCRSPRIWPTLKRHRPKLTKKIKKINCLRELDLPKKVCQNSFCPPKSANGVRGFLNA